MFRKVTRVKLQEGYSFIHRGISSGDVYSQKNLPSHTYEVGTCGIKKWEIETKLKKPEKKEEVKLPAHLIRPPCIPGTELGGFQTCKLGEDEGGLYCIPCRERYKYPPFSENIEFVPPKEEKCWWKGRITCLEDIDESPLGDITRPCAQDIHL
jgi:hypothetical protein